MTFHPLISEDVLVDIHQQDMLGVSVPAVFRRDGLTALFPSAELRYTPVSEQHTSFAVSFADLVRPGSDLHGDSKGHDIGLP